MKATKLFLALILVGVLIAPVGAQEKKAIVIGDSLKTGMPLKEAIALMGIPETMTIVRGTSSAVDSIIINYSQQGVAIHALNMGNVIEGIEIFPNFKGSFSSGIKLGANFQDLIGKYGAPQSLTKNIARYPKLGIYFLINKSDKKVLSAKAFSKDSKLLEHRLSNPLWD